MLNLPQNANKVMLLVKLLAICFTSVLPSKFFGKVIDLMALVVVNLLNFRISHFLLVCLFFTVLPPLKFAALLL